MNKKLKIPVFLLFKGEYGLRGIRPRWGPVFKGVNTILQRTASIQPFEEDAILLSRHMRFWWVV